MSEPTVTLVWYRDFQELDGEIVVLGAFDDVGKARKAVRVVNAGRKSVVDKLAAYFRETHGYDQKKAYSAANYQTARAMLMTVPFNRLETTSLFRYEPPTVEPVEPAHPPLPCPRCGAMIAEYDTELDALTWCDSCDWNGWASMLISGDKKGALIW